MRRRLLEGGTALGTFVQLPCPEVVEVLGQAGFDFAIVDLEHGPYGWETARQMFRAADAAGIAAICRIPEPRASDILKALDMGAAGLLLPQVETAADVRQAVSAAKYAPAGQRGFCSAVRSAGYKAPPGYTEAANQRVVVIAIIETLAACERLDEILAVEGLDAVLIGPGDLSSALGLASQFDHPRVKELLERLVDQVVANGVPCGIHVRTPAAAQEWLERGARIFTYGIDSQVLLNAFAGARAGIPREVQR